MIIGIIGVGLIGASMAVSLKDVIKTAEIIGCDQDQKNCEIALERGVIDRFECLEMVVEIADIIFLAPPVSVIEKMLPRILSMPNISDKVVIDCGSTKNQIVNSVKQHAFRGRYVAAHPMAGTEHSGAANAVKGLFIGKNMIICDHENSDKDALDLAVGFFKALSMNVLYMDSHSHDLHLAYVSHLSHITSFSLAVSVLEKERDEKEIFDLAAGGFNSTVRLAASNPATWTPIFLQNRENLIDAIESYTDVMGRFKEALINNDGEALTEIMLKCEKIKEIIKN